MSKLAVTVIALMGCGCVQETHELLLRSPASPTRDTTLVVEGESYDPRVEDVALLQVLVWGPVTEREAFASLTRRGSALGCDAVVRAHFEHGVTRSTATGVCVTWIREVRGSP